MLNMDEQWYKVDHVTESTGYIQINCPITQDSPLDTRLCGILTICVPATSSLTLGI